MPGLYVVLAVVFGLVPSALARAGSRVLIAGLVIFVALDAAGLAANLRLYPWTDVPVAGIAACGGTLLGRGMPPRFRPMALLLVALGALDTVQVFAAAMTHVPSATAQLYSMFVVSTPWADSGIGIFDLLVIAALGQHWRRRGRNPLVGVAPGLIGLLLTYPAVVFLPNSLPLIPFLLIGYLVTELLARLGPRRSHQPR